MPVAFIYMMIHLIKKKLRHCHIFLTFSGHGKKYDALRAQMGGVNCQIQAVTDSNPPKTLPKQGGLQLTEATLRDLTNS